MGEVKKIALITSMSNFERYKNTVISVHTGLKEAGGCALYVLTCYGLFTETSAYERGEASIYKLLEDTSFDGYIVDSNIGVDDMLSDIVKVLQKKGKPFIAVNFSQRNFRECAAEIEDFHSVILNGSSGICKMMEHLICEHNCSKINLVCTTTHDDFNHAVKERYRRTLAEHGMEVNERRIFTRSVNLPDGRALVDDFIAAGIDDAEATICVHDVHAIGMCLEMEARGMKVPEDMVICSLNRSTNSIAFRPDISGADRMDKMCSTRACELLLDMIAGKEVPMLNYIESEVHFGGSCGCAIDQGNDFAKEYQQLVLAKLEMGNQVRRMMQYNDSLDDVESVEDMAKNLRQMFKGLGNLQFVLCLNQNALDYISSDREFELRKDGRSFDYMMQAVVGETDRTGVIDHMLFPLSSLVPVKPKEGDLFLFYPVHRNEQVFGYITLINEYLPVEMYNYRICHESIGSSMENLHRRMIMRSTISKLEELHMKDAMTGLYNGFAWDRFRQDYIDRGRYCVVMLDMDGLKKINDGHGHLAGDVAIMIMANAIRFVAQSGDLVTRCGGDEFRILSNHVDAEYWLSARKRINDYIEAQIETQKLPYKFGVSLGFNIVNEEFPMSFEECCDKADYFMYEDKKSRKAMRE